MKRIIIILMLLVVSASFAEPYSISRYVVQSSSYITQVSEVQDRSGGTSYDFIFKTTIRGQYARVYIPIHDMKGGQMVVYPISDSTRSLINISYGTSNSVGGLVTYTETIKDSTLYWYKGTTTHVFDSDNGAFYASYLVIDVAQGTVLGTLTPTRIKMDVFVKRE